MIHLIWIGRIKGVSRGNGHITIQFALQLAHLCNGDIVFDHVHSVDGMVTG